MSPTRRPSPALRRAALAGLVGLSVGSCFQGQALWGERCEVEADCGPAYPCQADGFCAPVPACAAQPLPLTLADLRPRVVLVLDHSESMQRCLDDPRAVDACGASERPSRWDALSQLVRAIVEALQDRVDFAAVVFPSDDIFDALAFDKCRLNDNTQTPFGPDAAADILAAVPEDISREPAGENPIRRAWSAAKSLLDEPADGVLRDRAIVLVSDNPPNCALKTSGSALVRKLDAELSALVGEAADAGLPTLVVGVGAVAELDPADEPKSIEGIIPRDYFEELADLGGAPLAGASYIDLDHPDALPAAVDALTGILGGLADDVTRCRMRLDGASLDPDLVALEIDGRLRPEDPACADPLAWRYTDDARTELRLCDDACAQLHARPDAHVRLRFGCP